MYNTKDENLMRLMRKIRENPHSFIFIVGAGMSKSSGMPSWEDLARGMINYYEQLFQNTEDDVKAKVEQLKIMDNFWDVFSELKRCLPTTEYNKYIMEQLSDRGRRIPVNYKYIWKLDVCGVITFNIDKLILNAYSNVYQSSVDFATRNEFVKYNHFPASNEKFVFFPHGEISDPTSWVFTEEERKEVYRNRDVINVLTTLLNGKNLVIVGFNPREYSFLSLLNDISIGNTISGQDNYYIGNNISASDIKKLGNYGISCISYSPEDKEHSDIEKMFKSMYEYIPKDIEYSTVYEGKKYLLQDIPRYEECSSIGLDKLRDILNGNIANILPIDTVPTSEQLDRLQEFYRLYSAQLHMAWFVNPESDYGQKLHGFLLKKGIGGGAFGNVYEAYNDKNEKFAIKILLPEVKDKVKYLSCFRRGIRSMKMLKEHNVGGMVKIHSSYEVPACIVMDFVEGYTLREAIDKKVLFSLHKKLDVLQKIANIMHISHNLQECILHRDLKPENIMLENFYYEDDFVPLKVVILDFDLSWHKGATELTVALGAMSQGFKAPEQVEENENLTRNTAVDVYSIGMLSYYVLTGKNPMPNQHRFMNFEVDLIRDICDNYKIEWRCLAQFLAETIIKSTLQEAMNRLPLEAYLANIKVALDMILADGISNTHPLLLRELASWIDDAYEVYEFGRVVLISTNALGKQIRLELKQRNKDILVQVEIKKLRKGDENRSNTAKYLENAKSKALSVVKQNLFYYSKGEVRLSEVTVNLAAKLPKVVSHNMIVQMAENIKEIRAELELR